MKLNKVIRGSTFFSDDNLLFFKLENRFVTISEKEISLAGIFDESEVKRVMELIKKFFDAAERTLAE